MQFTLHLAVPFMLLVGSSLDQLQPIDGNVPFLWEVATGNQARIARSHCDQRIQQEADPTMIQSLIRALWFLHEEKPSHSAIFTKSNPRWIDTRGCALLPLSHSVTTMQCNTELMKTSRRRGNRGFHLRKPSKSTAAGPVVEALEERRMMTGGLTDLRLDFGPAKSPVASGWVRGTPELYTPSRGHGWSTFGWTNDFGIKGAVDAGTSNPLTRDGLVGKTAQYWVNAPTGTYDVTLTVGDATRRLDTLMIGINGGSSGKVLAHSLATLPGQYVTVAGRVDVDSGWLMVTLADGVGVTPSFTINSLEIHRVAPALKVDAGPDIATQEGAEVAFRGRVAENPGLTYTWNFGDGSTASGTLTPQHRYADNGVYTATLAVSDGYTTTSDSTTITVSNVAPTAYMAPGPYVVAAGESLTLNASAADPSPADTAAGFTYTWDFGDGTPARSGRELVEPSHTYGTPGIYTIRLSATDKDGATSIASTAQVVVEGGGAEPPDPRTLARINLTPGWATFGQALPEGAAHDALQLGSLVTQTDVKSTWADGSIKFAIVTAEIPVAGVYTLGDGTPAGEPFLPDLPDVEVRLNIGGTVYAAALPPEPSTDAWLGGPLVIETRTVVTPISPDGTPHPFLEVIFDTRNYRDGADRLDVSVENVLNIAGAGPVDYTVDIVADGRLLYHHDELTHFYMTRWRKTLPVDGLAESQIIPDLEPFYQANALPRYLETTDNQVDSPTGNYPATMPSPIAGLPKFDILQGGDLNPDMTAHGGRQELAPYPDWAARYLVHRDPMQRAYVLAHGDLAGSWPVHLREPADGPKDGLGTNRLVSIDERPNFWIDYGVSGSYPWTKRDDGVWVPTLTQQRIGPPDGPAGSPYLADRGHYYADNAHQPSLAYIPYLLTGDRYYADEMASWANFGLLSTYQDSFNNRRGGSDGLLGAGGNEVRGVGWVLRNLADAAAWLPDGDLAKPYLATRVDTNLAWLDVRAETATGPLGVAWLSQRFDEPHAGQFGVALWEHEYVAWAVGRANQQGFDGGQKWRDQVAQFQLRLFTDPSYDRAYAAPYVLAVAERTSGEPRLYENLGQVFAATYRPGTSPRPFAGYQGPEARLMLLVGIQRDWAGAEGAHAYLLEQLAPHRDLQKRAGWAISLD